jgi:hypothetical protein
LKGLGDYVYDEDEAQPRPSRGEKSRVGNFFSNLGKASSGILNWMAGKEVEDPVEKYKRLRDNRENKIRRLKEAEKYAE